MIPKLNRCPECRTEGPQLSSLWQHALEVHRAWHDLFFAFCEGLRIDRLAEWLARRLPEPGS